MIQRAALAGGSVAVDDFQNAHALAFGFPDFLKHQPAGFVQGREAGFDIVGFEVHVCVVVSFRLRLLLFSL